MNASRTALTVISLGLLLGSVLIFISAPQSLILIIVAVGALLGGLGAGAMAIRRGRR